MHDRSRKRNDESDDIETYRSNPAIQRLVQKLVAEQVNEAIHKNADGQKETPCGRMNKDGANYLRGKLKSPSEATIYTPAVGRMDLTNLNVSPNPTAEPTKVNLDNLDYALNSLRYISERERGAHGDGSGSTSQPMNESIPGPSGRQQPTGNDRSLQLKQAKQARDAADTAILNAERFKAQIQQPNRGMSEQLKYLRYLDSDDDEFFHTTCHIELPIKERIEKGAFVELEKLLQKKLHAAQENRLQLVNKDGATYFVSPIDRETKIDNIKKWEQAFRVYTTIYCNANPNRAGEILQYVDIIHRAAAIFNWDNVARYDYVFRQLMATKPHRSWAKVYTQMWNLTLNEPLKKFNEAGNGHNIYNGHRNNQKKKDSVCWKYNKSTCSYGKNCKFEHKCSYCGNFGHPALNCHKKQAKNKNKKEETTNK